MVKEKKGLYIGTEINEKWWKRYKGTNFFMRGSGEYWYDSKTFYFRRYLTKEPIKIPFKKATEIKLGTWHAGRWAYGNYIVKILWKENDKKLSSGFILSKTKEEAKKIKKILEQKIKS